MFGRESPVKITDSLDKANPTARDETYKWKIAAMIIGTISYGLAWYFLHRNISSAIDASYDFNAVAFYTVIRVLMHIGFISGVFGIAYMVIRLLWIEGNRKSLVNTNEYQMTFDQMRQLKDLELARLKAEIELMRAKTQLFPAGVYAINTSDSHNSTKNDTQNNTNAADDTKLLEDLVLSPDELGKL